MKHLRWIGTLTAIVAMATVLMHCSDDDKFSGPLTGKWQGESVKAHVEAFGIKVWEDSDEDFDAQLEFKDDGTVIASDDGQETEGTWEKNGSTLHTNVDLYYNGFSGDQDLKIKKLTETDLELFIEKDSTFEDPDTGLDISGTLKATAYFKRLPD